MFNYKIIDKKKIDEKKLLLSIKKLLPKYLNCLPDNAALSILEVVKKTKKNNLMLETGVGISTIALFIGSIISKKKFYSFDFNQEKISTVKQIINETICEPLKINLLDYWIPIQANSTCPYSGIKSLTELKKKFDFGFFDSNHTLEHLENEISLFLNLVDKKFFFGIDDAHMNYKKINLDYINLVRTKANLKRIKIKDNICKEFSVEISNFLKKKKFKVKNYKPIKKLNSKDDLYFKYYGNLVFKPGERKIHKTVFFKIYQ